MINDIKNPILRGFNPDPSILRVGEDYYIATSTFEWFPGVMIYHSRDLVNWELAACPLSRTSQLNMAGNPSSGGIWAPCLSYDKGIFYLIYTDVKVKNGIFKDTHNYLVTTDDIFGEWSDPVYLNSSGFDPSLFHDDDGKKYLVNMMWDFRPWKNAFAGILLQEYSQDEKRLVGPVKNIFKGTEIGLTEGPHLYKRNGFYYLMTAEGGTVWKHAVTMARSGNIDGPYTVGPNNPILTSYGDATLTLQKAGHASLVDTPDGQWYLVHLCGRPMPRRGKCVLGRETAIQKVGWTEDGWLQMANGGDKPLTAVPGIAADTEQRIKTAQFDDFDSDTLDIHFQTLRVPLGEDTLSLKERKGYLTLKGRESLSSHFTQSLVARRQQAFCYTSATKVEFSPESFQQMAGLICLYDTKNFFYLHITQDEDLGECLNIMTCDDGTFSYPLPEPVPVKSTQGIYLKANVSYDQLQFSYSRDNQEWIKIGGILDASILSDDYPETKNQGKFTGAFVGMCCQDLSGERKPAYFDNFEYIEADEIF